MADQRTMTQLLQAPTEVYEDAIVVPAITADNFELKHGLLTLVQYKQFFGHDKEDPHAHIWLEKEPPRPTFTWDDLVSKFINQFFPPSKTTNLRNEITNFQQHFNEYFSEAWDRFKDLLKACTHHGFSELHQLDTFYNALNLQDQDSLNSAAGGNFLNKMPRECLAITESKSKVHYSRSNPVVAKVSTNTSTSGISPDVAKLKDMVKALLLDKKSQNQSPAPVKVVEESCVTCGVNYNQGNISYRPPMIASTSRLGTLHSNTIANPRSDLKVITTQSGVSYDGPQILPPPSFLPKVVKNKPEATKDTVNPTNNGSTEDIFKDMSFEISFADALILMPEFASTLKALIRNKEKLSEIARTPLNEHCSAVILKKLPKKLRDPCKFLIPCDFLGMAECLALADLDASINLMPFSVWKRLYLFDLTPTCILELANRLISCSVRVVEDVYVKVGELTLRVGKYAITFNLDHTSRYSANYSDMPAKRIYVIDMACEEYSQEVLGFSNVISSGNPTPYYDPIVSTTSPTLTLFGNSDFLLEEVDAFLAIEDDPTFLEFYQPYLDPEGDILLLEAF
nr:reverse transcriptase domain-containing protein [Tanacetum cinerariifolium]